MRLRILAASLLLLSALATSVSLAAPPDSFPMREVYTCSAYAINRYPCGDADHDGNPEFVARIRDSSGWYVPHIFEHTGGNEFDTTWLGFLTGSVWVTGDADRDGLSDMLVTGYGGGHNLILMYESRDSFSFPDTCVWSESTGAVAGQAMPILADLDADSVPEVVYRIINENTYGVSENRGDNLFMRVDTVDPIGVPYSLAQTHDLDGDGYPELVGGAGTRVHFFEAAGDDSIVFRTSFYVAPPSYVSSVAAGPDIDGDGRPEALAFAQGIDSSVLAIYESPHNDSIELVWSADLGSADCDRVETTLSVGDVDGDSVPEIAVGFSPRVRLLKCLGDDDYAEVWSAPTYGDIESQLYDVNADGRCELIYLRGRTETVIMAYGDSVGIAETPEPERAVPLHPTVLTRAQLQCELLADPSLSLFDASGRRLLNSKSGVYFLRSPTTTRRVVVAR